MQTKTILFDKNSTKHKVLSSILSVFILAVSFFSCKGKTENTYITNVTEVTEVPPTDDIPEDPSINPEQDVYLTDLTKMKFLGGSGDEQIRRVVPTDQGGFLLSIWSNSINGGLEDNHGNFDAWLVLLDSQRQVVWKKCFGGSHVDIINDIEKTPDGFMLLGNTRSVDGDLLNNQTFGGNDIWLFKIDHYGNIIWNKCIGTTDSDMEESGQTYPIKKSLHKTLDNNFIIHAYPPKIIKIDPSGNELWTKTLDTFRSMEMWPTLDGGFIATGFGGYLTKFDAAGNIQWERTYHDIHFYSVKEVSGRGYVVAGNATEMSMAVANPKGGGDAYVIHLDYQGNKIWDNPYGGTENDQVKDIFVTPDNDLLLLGGTNSADIDIEYNHGGNIDAWIYKLNIHGHYLWNKTIGEDGQLYSTIENIAFKSNGNLIVSSTVFYYDENQNLTCEARLQELDKINGNVCWEKRLNINNLNRIMNLNVDSNDNISIIAQVGSGGYVQDIVVFKLNSSGGLID